MNFYKYYNIALYKKYSIIITMNKGYNNISYDLISSQVNNLIQKYFLALPIILNRFIYFTSYYTRGITL